MQRTTTTTILVAALLVGTAAGPAVVAAQTDESGLFRADDVARNTVVALEQIANRLLAGLPIVSEDDDRTASDHATRIASYVNDHNATLTDWLNNQSFVEDRDDLTPYDVLKLRFQDDDGTAVRYLVAEVDNGTIQSFEIVTSTSREVDYSLTFSEYATERLRTDLEWIVTEYAEPGEAADGRLKGRLAGAYGPFQSMVSGEISVEEGNVTDS